MKVVLGIVGVLAVLVVAAVIILPLVVDPNDHKDRIVKLVEKRTGREFELGVLRRERLQPAVSSLLE